MPSGKLRKRGDKWYLDIHTGRVIDGKHERIKRRAKGDTRKKAQTELNEELHRLDRHNQGAARDNRYPLEELKNEWLGSIKLKVKSDKIFQDYSVKISRVTNWLAERGVLLVSELTPKIFEEWQREELKSFSPRTVRLTHQFIHRALTQGVERGHVYDNPISTVAMVAKRRVKFRRDLRPEEVSALLENSTPAFKDIWIFLLCTGCRLEEMVELRREAVDLNKKTLRIQEYTDWAPKTRAAIRTIPIQDDLVEILRNILSSHKNSHVFVTTNGSKRTNNVLKRFKTSMRAALYSLRGIPTRKNLSKKEADVWAKDIENITEDLKKLDIHSLRYTFITELISSGANPKSVQYLAGHADIQTTLNVYAQCRPESVEGTIKSLPWDFSSQIRPKSTLRAKNKENKKAVSH